MEQYIPKSALVAKIEKLKGKVSDSSSYCNGWQQALRMLELSIDTMQEEPVSEDLEKEFDDIYYKLEKEYARKTGLAGYYKGYNFSLKIARHFANWQKEQFEKNRLAASDAQTVEEAEIERDFFMGIIEKEHRQPTFDDAIKYGMRLQKKQMLEKAVMTAFNVSLPCGVYDRLKAKGCKEGDKLLIIIKED